MLLELRTFARPLTAAVGDTGNFIIHDTGFGSALQSDLVAVSSAGDEMFRRHYKANIYNPGLSDCGRYASVQTAGAPEDDGNLLEVLDLKARTTMFSVKPEQGWAERYGFKLDGNGQLQALVVEYRDIGKFRFSATGLFMDEEKYQNACLNKGDFTIKIRSARALLKKSPTSENAQKVLCRFSTHCQVVMLNSIVAIKSSH